MNGGGKKLTAWYWDACCHSELYQALKSEFLSDSTQGYGGVIAQKQYLLKNKHVPLNIRIIILCDNNMHPNCWRSREYVTEAWILKPCWMLTL